MKSLTTTPPRIKPKVLNLQLLILTSSETFHKQSRKMGSYMKSIQSQLTMDSFLNFLEFQEDWVKLLQLVKKSCSFNMVFWTLLIAGLLIIQLIPQPFNQQDQDMTFGLEIQEEINIPTNTLTPKSQITISGVSLSLKWESMIQLQLLNTFLLLQVNQTQLSLAIPRGHLKCIMHLQLMNNFLLIK